MDQADDFSREFRASLQKFLNNPLPRQRTVQINFLVLKPSPPMLAFDLADMGNLV